MLIPSSRNIVRHNLSFFFKCQFYDNIDCLRAIEKIYSQINLLSTTTRTLLLQKVFVTTQSILRPPAIDVCRHSTVDCRRSTVDCRHPIVFSSAPTAYSDRPGRYLQTPPHLSGPHIFLGRPRFSRAAAFFPGHQSFHLSAWADSTLAASIQAHVDRTARGSVRRAVSARTRAPKAR